MLLLAPGGCLHSLASGDITPASASVSTLPRFRLHPIFPALLLEGHLGWHLGLTWIIQDNHIYKGPFPK